MQATNEMWERRMVAPSETSKEHEAPMLQEVREHLDAVLDLTNRMAVIGLGSPELQQCLLRATEARAWLKSHGSDAAFGR